ncbi:MAG: UDP-N-acetylmuramoyl-tripeptide--D-alanyl-D-alanine ligase [Bacteroidales bacterium]|nr:UDP-N-acetylmuramoyl-tripeptide--D-alanyl-D-alanine ligase [Bacteroidales bacterium]
MFTSVENLYKVFCKYPVICTDSRKIKPNSIFFALKGENFNGNKYAEPALQKGAKYAVIDEEKYKSNDRFILVENVQETLQQLAGYHRKMLNLPVIGITGTNGKTTTKELIAAVLKQKYKVLATTGNFNNHIGVPLTILGISKETEIAIIEMGANHIGEISALCNISCPGFGLITNIGKAHLEGFGSIEGIIKSKAELYKYISNNEGFIFVNDDNNTLKQLAKYLQTINYGTNENSDCRAKLVSSNPFVEILWNSDFGDVSIKSNLVGKYNFENILAAVCVGDYFNVKIENIAKAIEEYIPQNNRSQFITTKKNKIFLDAYNANPSSMEAAIRNFAELDYENKVLIIGDMLELGSESLTEHRSILKLVQELGFNNNVFLIGNEFCEANKNIKHKFFLKTEDAMQWFKANRFENATIFIKGSRGIKLEPLIEVL